MMWSRQSNKSFLVLSLALLLVNPSLGLLRDHIWRSLFLPIAGSTLGGSTIHVWNMVELALGVIIFPSIAFVILWRWFGYEPIHQWSIRALLAFLVGLLALGVHIIWAYGWMLDRTLPVPSTLVKAMVVGTQLLPWIGIPLVAIGVVVLWIWRRKVARAGK